MLPAGIPRGVVVGRYLGSEYQYMLGLQAAARRIDMIPQAERKRRIILSPEVKQLEREKAPCKNNSQRE